MQQTRQRIIWLFFLILTGCGVARTGTPVAETAVIPLPLNAPLNAPNAELSGLAWAGDWLILLPEEPGFDDTEPAIYALPRQQIIDHLAQPTAVPLQPIMIPLHLGDLPTKIPNFGSLEAVAFRGQTAVFLVETSTMRHTSGYLVRGELAADMSELRLETALITPLPRQTPIRNIAYEALFWADDQIVVLYEANGVEQNPTAQALLFDEQLQPVGELPMPNVPYRLTDMTELGENGRLWATNYFFPTEYYLNSRHDPLGERFGWGTTHQQQRAVERLVAFTYQNGSLTLDDVPPIQLQLSDGPSRNWEGIAQLGDQGFLLATDRYPETIFAFAPMP